MGCFFRGGEQSFESFFVNYFILFCEFLLLILSYFYITFFYERAIAYLQAKKDVQICFIKRLSYPNHSFQNIWCIK